MKEPPEQPPPTDDPKEGKRKTDDKETSKRKNADPKKVRVEVEEHERVLFTPPRPTTKPEGDNVFAFAKAASPQGKPAKMSDPLAEFVTNTAADVLAERAAAERAKLRTKRDDGRADIPFDAKLPKNWNPDEHWHRALDEKDRQILRSIEAEIGLFSDNLKFLAKGKSRCFIVTGPSGWGKSYMAMKFLSLLGIKYQVLGPRVTPIEFYRFCWKYRHGDYFLIAGDAENIMLDKAGCDLIKCAVMPRGQRRLYWHTSRAPVFDLYPEDLTPEEYDRFVRPLTGLPASAQVKWFDFDATLIVDMNVDIRKEAENNPKLRLKSITPRVLLQQIRLYSPHERMLRVAYAVAKQGLLHLHGYSLDVERDVMHYAWENYRRFYDMDLNVIERLAALRSTLPSRWRVMAEDNINRGPPHDDDGSEPPKPTKGRRK